ncbi:NADH-quinone oxidoreductase subunit A [Buchnera aphidicola (Thelaxes californica)]|uniref:NADH-quinone oxidoreductase subunit n=1 Tax=Buchnera aphidicola (Thelaxes californica) TaxID=1315998 RepID=A0A4D6YL22_9GAMM|nr:NADH-quinone oxidoreductase subunit A [Buchnera aphidicola]QCI26674.1 NADH-quinone oxidoreductase subunit A [Buchnera aphidicola (Thelaxes californica)]
MHLNLNSYIFNNPQQLSFFLYFVISIVLCSIILLISYVLGEKNTVHNKNIPFESGIIGVGTTDLRFSIKFYLIAILFVLFDVEALYLYAWSICAQELGLDGLIKVFFFILTLLVSLMYIVKKKVFI